MTDDIATATQTAASILTIMIGLLLFLRWNHVRQHPIPGFDTSPTLYIALFVFALGVKQTYWTVWRALLANGLDAAASQMATGLFPVAMNMVMIVTGGIAIALAARSMAPRSSLALIGLGVGTLAVAIVAVIG